MPKRQRAVWPFGRGMFSLSKRRVSPAASSVPLPKRQPTLLPKLQRTLSKPDGCCLIRLVIHAAGVALPDGVDDILNGDTSATRRFCTEVRKAAAESLLDHYGQDKTLAMVVESSFPDDNFHSLEEWAAAMSSNDSSDITSALWHGDGHWLLYGLGLMFGISIYVTPCYPLHASQMAHVLEEGSPYREPPPMPVVNTDVPAARRVDLVVLHDDEGTPCHFDVLEPPLPPLEAVPLPELSLLQQDPSPPPSAPQSRLPSARPSASPSAPSSAPPSEYDSGMDAHEGAMIPCTCHLLGGGARCKSALCFNSAIGSSLPACRCPPSLESMLAEAMSLHEDQDGPTWHVEDLHVL